MKLAYRAINSSGALVADTIEADSMLEATQLLHRKGLMVSEMEPAEHSTIKAAGMNLPGLLNTKGRRLRHLVSFARNLHVLLSSGTSIVGAIAALLRQSTDVQWRKVLSSLKEKVEEGSSLADAMRQFPEYFNPVACSLIGAGESSGKLQEMLDRLGKLARQQLHIRRQVQGALSYPAMVVCVGMVVMCMLVWVVLPRFSQLFESMKVPLPPSTEVLMFFADIVRGYWWALLIGIAATAIVLWQLLISEAGRAMIDRWLVRLPGVGHVVRSFITARIVRMLGVLLASKVSLLDALRLTRDATDNREYTRLLTNAEESTALGKSISNAFADDRLISPSVREAISNGEESGAVDQLLLTMADFMDEDNDVLLRSLLSIMGPAILVVLGVVVGFVAVSLFLPLFDLTAGAANGGAG